MDWSRLDARGAIGLISSWMDLRVEGTSRGRGYMGFTNRLDLHVVVGGQEHGIGLIAWGGASQRDRVYVSLTAAGCALVLPHWWGRVADSLDACGAKITRVDLALDDMTGHWSVDRAAEMYRQGAFVSSGRPPSHELRGPWLTPGAPEGRTLYVGKRENGKMLRAYEKGKQLGDPASPWVRWEVELRSVDRVIPLDVLRRPDQFFVGAYPALHQLLAVAGERVAVQRAIDERTVESMTRWCRASYGRLFDFLLSRASGDYAAVVEAVRAKGVPKGLAGPALRAGADARPSGLSPVG